MNDAPALVGRVIRADTTSFTIGCQQPMTSDRRTVPPFGALVRAENGNDSVTYGLVANVIVEDDPFVRQLVAAGVEDEEYIADQRQRRQIPVAVEVLIVGGGQKLAVHHRLPAQPPGTLDRIYACNAAELVRFTERHDWLRTVLAAMQLPADALVVAALRGAAAARRASGQHESYLIGAGRELAKLLAFDLTRLDGILRQVRDE